MNMKERRPRLAFADEEVRYLMDGVEKFKDSPQRWRKILSSYDFNPRRTSVDLKDKWRNIVRVDPKKETNQQMFGHKKVQWSKREIEALKLGFEELGEQKNPWANILSKYKDDFDPVRTSVHLKDKWRNLSRAAKRGPGHRKTQLSTMVTMPRSGGVGGPLVTVKEEGIDGPNSSSSSVAALRREGAKLGNKRSREGATAQVEEIHRYIDEHGVEVEERHIVEEHVDDDGEYEHHEQVVLDENGNPTTDYVEEVIEYVEEDEHAAHHDEEHGHEEELDSEHEIEEHIVEEEQPDGTVVQTITRNRVRKRRRLDGEEQVQEEVVEEIVQDDGVREEEEIVEKVVETTEEEQVGNEGATTTVTTTYSEEQADAVEHDNGNNETTDEQRQQDYVKKEIIVRQDEHDQHVEEIIEETVEETDQIESGNKPQAKPQVAEALESL